jgi:hypothetical protein
MDIINLQMKEEALNEELKKLYEKKFPSLTLEINAHNERMVGNNKHIAANPLLIQINSDWVNADLRVMIFGQETNFWGSECGNNGIYSGKINELTKVYNDFIFAEKSKKHKGPFWNEYKRIRKQVGSKTKSSFIYNNINKIGIQGKGNCHLVNEIQFNYFKVIGEEIKILRPHVLILFTGKNYDNFIIENLGKFSSSELMSENILEELKFDNPTFKCFRTFHPNALYFKKIRKGVIDEVIERILGESHSNKINSNLDI